MIGKRDLLALVSVGTLVVALSGVTAGEAIAQPEGSIGVSATRDMIHGSGFGPDVTLEIQRGATTATWVNGVSGPWEYDAGYDSFVLYLQGTWDVQPGDHVTVQGNGLTDEMTVADLRVTSWQLADNAVSGTVSPYDNSYPIFLSVSHYAYQESSTLVVQRTGVTDWTADLNGADPAYQLRVNDWLEACQPDAAQNESCTDVVLAGPRFAFGVELQEAVGLDWPAGVPVTLTVNRPNTRKAVFKATTTPPTAESYASHLQTGNGGTVYFDLTQAASQTRPGDLMTMTNGTVTKTLTVPALTTSLPDLASGVVTGTAPVPPAGGFLSVSSGQFAWGGTSRQDVTPSAGTWTADFGPGGIDPASTGAPVAYLTDTDGDMAESQAPAPSVWVDPTTDRVWAIDLGPGAVTLTVTQGSAAPYVTTVATTNVLTKGSWNIDMWATPTGTLPRPAVALFDLKGLVDLVAGDQLQVTDGTSELAFPVADLSVDSVTPDPGNTVTGHASGVDTVTLHLGDGENGYWGYGAPVVDGIWSMTFDPTQFPNPPTGLVPGSVGQAIVGASVLGSGTVVRWTVPSTLTEPDQLVPEVQALVLPSRVERQLVSLLGSAQRSYDAARLDSGNRTMAGFIDKVGSLRGTTIPAAAADRLVADARSVIAAHS